MLDKDIDEIIQIMGEASCKYIFSEMDKCEWLETSGLFRRFVECEGDSYRVYQVIK